ncbi:MAG: hypothetical protein GXP54_04135 [Deltaproteobacteria bacterium]|nr:hypothetical protein [Deltaproteobacteria bacterium]
MRCAVTALVILIIPILGCGGDNAGADALADVADTGPEPVDAVDAVDADAARLPFTRPEKGEPVSPDELKAATTMYLGLLDGTRYFAATNERVHGWPRSDPKGRYWYGTWWSGVKVVKQDGKVTFLHREDGSDNNGMRTGPILSAACFAQVLWGDQGDLVRKLVRGFNSWSLAMDRESVPNDGRLLARAAYPESILSTDDGIQYFIDYSLNRPGKDLDEPNPPSIYVHNPDNPQWGDIWVKNKRSKDDIGHMLQAIAFLPACTVDADPGFQADLDLLRQRYQAWCRGVEDNDWGIVTVDGDWNEETPPEDLAHYIDAGNAECKSMLAIRLYGRGDPGDLDCGNGLSLLDEEWLLKNDFHQINRSYHEAAAAMAFMEGFEDLGDRMLEGLAWRLDTIFDAKEDPDTYDGPHDQDLAELVTMSAAVGLPLTWREVRFLHQRIKEAHDTYLSGGSLPAYRVFDKDVPDGEYPYNPGGGGFFWRYLGTVLGTCASPYRNPTSRPVLDCDMVRAHGSEK